MVSVGGGGVFYSGRDLFVIGVFIISVFSVFAYILYRDPLALFSEKVMAGCTVHWFRKGLRLHDNAGSIQNSVLIVYFIHGEFFP